MTYITASFGTDMVPVVIGVTFWVWIQVATGHAIELNKWVLSMAVLEYRAMFHPIRMGSPAWTAGMPSSPNR
jgi:hypothetical protein